MTRRVRFLDVASLEARDAARWYETEQSGLGERFLAEVERAIAKVHAMPETWPLVTRRTRRALVREFPYLLLYQVRPDEILVIAVMHQRRDPTYWVDRET